MKYLLYLLALGAATPVWAQDAPPTIPKSVAPLIETPTDSAPFAWRLHFQAGQKFRTTTETASQTSQQMPALPGAPGAGGEMENSSQSHVVIDQNVLSVDEKGARIEMIYREMTQNSVMKQGSKVVYDSAHPPAQLKGLSDLTKNIVGARLSFSLSPQGELSDVQGVEEYLNRFMEGMEKGLDATPQSKEMIKPMRQMMQGLLSPEALQNSLGMAYRSMPTQPVKPGQSWTYATALPMMGTTMTQNGKGIFVSRAGGQITLSQTGDFATDAGAEFKIPMPATAKGAAAPKTQLDLHGTTQGETIVDENSGMVLSSRTTQNIAGEIVMSGIGEKGSVTTIAMTVTGETTSKTEILP